MSRIKTLLTLFLLSPAATWASSDTLLNAFASCTGRFSAELEHAWLMHDESADEIAHRRQQFVDLLEAVTPADQRRAILHRRIEAKIAHAGLLSQASFSEDADRSVWALRRAATEMNYCAGFLLES